MSKNNQIEFKKMQSGDIRVVLYTPQGSPAHNVITPQEHAARVATRLQQTATKYYA